MLGTLKNFEKNPCVWAVVWCVGTLKLFKAPLCVRLCHCTGKIEFSQKKSLCWGFSPVLERLIFSGENPCAGDFLAPFSPKKNVVLDGFKARLFSWKGPKPGPLGTGAVARLSGPLGPSGTVKLFCGSFKDFL